MHLNRSKEFSVWVVGRRECPPKRAALVWYWTPRIVPTHLKSSCHMRGLGRSRKCSERRLRTLRTLTADCDAVKGLGARIAEEVEVV